MSRSLTTTKGAIQSPHLPTHRAPVHPGEMLVEEFLRPLRLTQAELATRLHVPFQRVNQICNRRRAVTPDTALRLSRFFGTSPEFWLNLQQRWDLYAALRADSRSSIVRVRPLRLRAA